ncbi:MAG TPA: HAD-IA family hydrolase [Gaiellaceae bacterium]
MRSTRAAITLVFLADGLLIGSWAARIPAVQRQNELTSGELGLALFAMSLGALLAMPAAGRLSERIGSRSVTIAALLAGGAALFLTSVAGGLGGLSAALFLFGAGFGAVNVAANAQGLALERLGLRSILSSFHAAFSFGGLAGAGLGALAAAGGIDPVEHFGATALAIGLAALIAGSRLLPPDADDREPTPILARPQRALILVGAAAFFTLLAEGAAADWSAVYLSDSLGAGAAVAALGYTLFSLAMAASRVFGDRLNGLLGPVALARGGGLLAASALALALLSGSTATALVGFAAMGAGLGVVVPVLFRAAGSTPGISAGAGVAVVSTIGWMGFLAGPPAIGVTADAVGLRGALAIVVVATLGLAVLAGSASPRRGREFRGLLFEPGAVLSDMDGVLVDSWTAIERTWRRFAQRHGLDPEVVLAASHGRPTIDVIRDVAPHLDADAEAAAIDREQIHDVDGLRALPGARELVDSVPAGRFAIVTSASRRLAESRLRAAGLPVPDVLVTADEVENGKPDPAGYLRAASLLGVDPAHSIVLEDAPAGVEAGVAAGMTVVGVLTTNSESALRSAHSRVPDLAALLPERSAASVLRDRRLGAATGRPAQAACDA